jgi:serine/threonine-protein phosphatase 5
MFSRESSIILQFPHLHSDRSNIVDHFWQAYYRRGVAYAAILRPTDAQKDLQIVVKKAPTDKDAKLKLAECARIVKRNAFEKAIEIGDEPSAAEGLDIDSMSIDSAYDGVKLEKEMTQEFIDDMIDRFKNGKKIHKKYVYQIIIAVKKIVYQEATMVEMKIPDDATMTVCGDTHGMNQLPTFVRKRAD